MAIDARCIRLGIMAEEETSKRIRKSPQERRAEVLDAAVQLISERGFNGISIQDVADRVGISKQGVLRHVDNKDKMLALVYDEYYGPARRRTSSLRACRAATRLRRIFPRICATW